MTRFRSVLPYLLAIAATITGITISVLDSDGDGRRDTIDIHIERATPTPTPTSTPAPEGELDPATDPAQLRDATPDDVPDPVLEQANQAEKRIAENAGLPPVDDPNPVGGAQGYSCRRDFAPASAYGYAQARIMSFKLHYAVAFNRPGWGDVDGVGDYMDRAGLSSTFVIDFEGNCEQKVPFGYAPYTQGAFNPTSESVEIIAYGTETRAQWLASPLIKKGILAALVRDRLKTRGLPLRFVDPVGCVDQLGYTDHNHLECGNDHHDVSPNFPFKAFHRQLVDGPQAITKRDRRSCRRVHRYRHRPASRRTRGAERRQASRLRFVRGHGLRCVKGKPKTR